MKFTDSFKFPQFHLNAVKRANSNKKWKQFYAKMGDIGLEALSRKNKRSASILKLESEIRNRNKGAKEYPWFFGLVFRITNWHPNLYIVSRLLQVSKEISVNKNSAKISEIYNERWNVIWVHKNFQWKWKGSVFDSSALLNIEKSSLFFERKCWTY